MYTRARWVSVVLLAAVILSATAVSPASARTVGDVVSEAPAVGERDAQTSTGRIEVTQSLRLTPAEPGSVRVTQTVRIPSNVESLETTLPEGSTALRTDGFSRDAGRTYEWDGETTPASITYDLAANRTGESLGPEGGSGTLVYADPGPWAIVERPPVSTRYRYRGSVTVDRETTVADEGVAGSGLIYLGPHETVTRTAHGQTFRLVVPRAADLAPSRADVFESMIDASDALRVGDRDETVLMIVAPESVDWGVEGLQLGDADFYVTADERLDEPANTWLHEYVHTRQNFSLGPGAKWTREASATYFAALLGLEQGRIEFETFRSFLDRGSRTRFADAVLAREGTWTAGTQYYKGGLVAGALDRRLREATNRTATFQRIFRAMNAHPGTFSADDFYGALEREGGEHLAEAGRRYAGTTATPSTWSADSHLAAFERLPARIGFGLPALDNGTAWGIAGPYRNGSIDATDLRLVPGERLTVAVPVTNAGGTTGTYTLQARLDGTVVDERSGSVPPDSTVREPIAVAPTAPGEHTLAVGTSEVTMSVREPSEIDVADLSVNRSTVPRDGAVALSVTVTNPSSWPAECRLSLTVDGGAIIDRTVRLAPGEEGTVRSTIRPSTTGEQEWTLGNRSVTVAVVGNGPGGATTDGAGPGFGLGAALAALVAVLGVLRRRPPERRGR